MHDKIHPWHRHHQNNRETIIKLWQRCHPGIRHQNIIKGPSRDCQAKLSNCGQAAIKLTKLSHWQLHLNQELIWYLHQPEPHQSSLLYKSEVVSELFRDWQSQAMNGRNYADLQKCWGERGPEQWQWKNLQKTVKLKIRRESYNGLLRSLEKSLQQYNGHLNIIYEAK